MKLGKRLLNCIGLSYSFFKIFIQLLYGIWRVSKLVHPVVAICGSSKMKRGDIYMQKAQQIASLLVEKEISVMTGGGPGIMQATNCGALRPGHTDEIHSIGIGVRTLNEPKNICVEEYFELDYLFARKWLLTHYSRAFIVLPGGFGTLDELLEVLALIQTKQMKKMPIVLIGTQYWAPFIEWLNSSMIYHGLITVEDLNLIRITDDPHEAVSFIQETCEINESMV